MSRAVVSQRLSRLCLQKAVEHLECRRLLAAEGGLLQDWGDAPDSYATVALSNGAYHLHTPNMHLGATVDPEPDGMPSGLANRDDTSGADDEDGVIFTTPLLPGAPASIDVINGAGGGRLNAWIDFNADGDFDPTVEQIATDLFMNPASINTINFIVPPGAAPGITYGRFRLNEVGGLGPRGFGDFGEVEDYQVKIEDPTGGGGTDERFDFGDNPDSYRTRLIVNGPRHKAVPDLHFGPKVDIEVDGGPSANADRDDLTNADDEDGISFTSNIDIGSSATLDMNNGGIATGLVDAWVDFNRDGDFVDPGEQIYTSLVLPPGTHAHSFAVPASAVEGPSYARFRISFNGGLNYFGYGYEGEVEDYSIRIRRNPDTLLDYGDAPDTYRTTLGVNGARHTPSTQFRLGGKVDAEPNGQPSVGADGDDLNTSADEDGIVFLDPIAPGATVRVQVTNGGTLPGRLDAWLDVLANGDFTDPFDQIFTNVGVAPGVNTLTFTVPTFANVGSTYTRFRISPNGVPAPFGFGFTGEVEDYRIRVEPVSRLLDFGDAPEFAGVVGYPTTLGGAAGNPARHLIAPNGPRLGLSAVDPEADGQPNTAATGDDLATSDDEDGVTIGGTALNAVTFTRGASYVVNVVNGGPLARLNAWFDWNQNASWEPAEQVATDLVIPAGGTASITIVVPASLAVNSSIYSRFRINTAGGLTPQGFAQDGEVEDYRTIINDVPTLAPLDYGDAPTSALAAGYPTLLSSNGARHGREANMPILGNLWDSETDGQPTVTALGDDNLATDDEDGVFDTNGLSLDNASFTAGRFNRVVVDVGGGSSGFLNGWVDLNFDQDWNDPGEHFINDDFTTGLNTYAFFLPATYTADRTYLRFRVSTVAGLGTTGAAKNGEVEDYRVNVVRDTVKPQVVRSRFEYKLRQALTLYFSEPIDPATLAVGDLLVENLDDGNVYTPVAVIPNVAFDAATFVFNTPGTFVSNGDYRFTLAAGAVADPSGNGNIGPHVVQGAGIFYLAGDATRDRKVDFDDLLTLAQNYNTLGNDFSQGNFNYSAGGGVDFDDLLILAQNYGQTLFSATPIGGSRTQRTRMTDAVLG